jgi:sporulation protein YlmC with PRC-barrel domain
MTGADSLASKVIGMNVYIGAAQNSQQIGTVKDLVLDPGGNVTAAVIGVGGFLGVGQKDVAVNYPQLKWTTASDGSMRATLNVTKDALNAAPAFKYPAGMNSQAMVNTRTPAVQSGTTAMTQRSNGTGIDNNSIAAASNDSSTTTANRDVDPATLTALGSNTIKTDDMKGTDVISPTGQKLGSISDFVLTKGGKVDSVIVDFGGFLGMGTKQVAIADNGLKFMTGQNNKRYLEVDVTKSQLNAQQAYNKATYATDRAQQRLSVNS